MTESIWKEQIVAWQKSCTWVQKWGKPKKPLIKLDGVHVEIWNSSTIQSARTWANLLGSINKYIYLQTMIRNVGTFVFLFVTLATCVSVMVVRNTEKKEDKCLVYGLMMGYAFKNLIGKYKSLGVSYITGPWMNGLWWCGHQTNTPSK
jgi:hypothetical protein